MATLFRSLRAPRPIAALAVALMLSAATRPLVAQSTDADDPPTRVARISALLGTVSLQVSGDSDWSLASLNYSMTTGDRLFTDAGARAELEIGPFTVRIADSTDLTLSSLSDGFAQFAVAQGAFRLTVYRLEADDSVEIDTPNGALIVRTPGHYRVTVPATGDYSTLTIDDGSVDVDAPGLSQQLTGAQSVSLTGTDPVALASEPRVPTSAFDAWSNERDQRVATTDCGRYVSTDTPGCADLAQYGTWDATPDYGPVWYPTHVVAGWAPYRYGHWVWVEPWGWVWVESEPWGFAPFHYGRWARIGVRWAWVPGPIIRPRYAPALVVFLGGGTLGVGVQAWFPLGPREPYFPWYSHGPRYLRSVNEANVRGVRDIDGFVRVTDVQRVHWVNREHGYTAVRVVTVRNGHRVDGAIIHPRGGVGGARVIDHPAVMPARRIALGGPPSPRPPKIRRPPMVPSAPRRPATGGEERRTPATEARPVTPARPPSHATEPARPPSHATEPARRTPRPIITRRSPPPRNPPFNDRAQAMKPEPGRPLPPQEMQKIRDRKPAEPAPGAKTQPRRPESQPRTDAQPRQPETPRAAPRQPGTTKAPPKKPETTKAPPKKPDEGRTSPRRPPGGR